MACPICEAKKWRPEFRKNPRFYSPFETGVRINSGWRWYWRELNTVGNGMHWTVISDYYEAIRTVVWC